MSNMIFDQEGLRRQIGRLLLSIQAERSIDLLAVQMVVEQVKELAKTLKGSELLPRTVLYELHTAIKILRAEIPHIKHGRDDVVRTVDEIELAFDLILRGECHESRVPGVPRIV
ncbi:hypothetical protein [Paludibacterium paludis]|uniref:Uncharacterized protein n=1 Tax=Paludibacterium paludis TaxID=1225769 RepID=A0A918P598_9NEIS|nr:hypothetical protein [Paludibacterium paludis]GGY21192.1 hypothetical protein GCM10011289_26110 [Paludibacterium paludis]